MSDWAPSVDHVTLKSKGGQLTLDNIRLAHVLCNRVDYAIKHGKRHDKDLERAKSGQFRDGHQASLQQGVYDRLPELVRDAEGLSHESSDDAEKAFHRGRAASFDEILCLMSVDN